MDKTMHLINLDRSTDRHDYRSIRARALCHLEDASPRAANPFTDAHASLPPAVVTKDDASISTLKDGAP